MGFARIAVMFALFMAVGIASIMFRQDVEDETQTEGIQEPEDHAFQPVVDEFPVGEPVTVSGLSYKVTNASVGDSWFSGDMGEEAQGEYVLISMYVENLSGEPKSELRKSDFVLADSEDRRFRAIKSLSLLFGESWDTLQPGLGGYRGLVFQIPFDSELEYKLLVRDNKMVQLGMGKDLSRLEL